MNALERHRNLTHHVLIGFLCLHVGVVFFVARLMQGPWLQLSGAAVVAAVVAVAMWAFVTNGRAVRATIAIALMTQISLLLAALKGHEWQVDAHLYYFAMLALIGFYCDAFAVIAAAALVAVHHIGLNYLLPSALYPGGGDFGRVSLHAVVLVIETSGLVLMGEIIRRAFLIADTALQAAEEAQSKAQSEAKSAIGEADGLRVAERRSVEDRQNQQAQSLAEQARMADLLGAELARLAEGDLTSRVEGGATGAYGRLASDLNSALARLETTLGNVRQAAHGVRSQTGAIDEVASELSRRAEAQAGQLEQVASSVGQMVELVGRTSSGAIRARDVVAAADEDAKSSSQVVGRAIDAMAAITVSSTKIGSIIGVIDEIAFQTNLLALNAGVEAARAGDAGRGFAVVASEVRALAQRSAQAAKEIKALISTSVAQVGGGADLVRQTGETLQRIVGRVSEINGVVGDIAASASEQSRRIADIDGAMREMEQSTRDTVSMSERASAASSALAGESETLDQLIGQFRLDDGAARRRPSREGRLAA